MPRAKEITFKNYIRIGSNEPRLVESFTKEERKELVQRINDNGMSALGYERVDNAAT